MHLKAPLQKLKEAIGRTMPEQMAQYQDEFPAHHKQRLQRCWKRKKTRSRVNRFVLVTKKKRGAEPRRNVNGMLESRRGSLRW